MSAAALTAARIREWLVQRLAAQLQLPSTQVETDQPLFAYGIDSKFAIELSAGLGELLGRSFDPTLLFAHPSIERVVQYLVQGDAVTAGCAVPTTQPASGAAEPIAIVGIACRMPGAPDSTAFWELLLAGRDAIAALPPEDVRAATPGMRAAGYIEAVDQFDAAFFRIAPLEARSMDPQQRLLLQLAWHALEDAGHVPARLRGTRGGVFIGASHSDYGLRQYAEPEISAFSGTGTALSILANRLSYFYGLHGPSLAVDTACSSSLVATHLAVASLQRGECDWALAGGVNLLLAPQVTAGLANAGMLSPDARCRTFDAGANGYVRAEGAGLVVLKTLTQALADADRIYAVIKGSAVNQDGRSNGLTAPNRAAQQALLQAACAAAGVEPSEVDFVETHGTGTALGDPVEAKALSAVLCAQRPAERALVLGAVKSNIGHLEAAAGIAGLIKTALALHHGRIPGNLHFKVANPHLDLAAAGLDIPTQARPWPRANHVRTAGVSGFGFGGTNVHVVLQEAPATAAAVQLPRQAAPQLIMLSAATAAGLQRTAENWQAWLAQHPDASLADLAHTSLARREQLPVRRGFIAASHDELRRELAQYVAAPEPVASRLRTATPRVLFVYPGSASGADCGPDAICLARMRELLPDSLFRSNLRRCEERLQALGLFMGSLEQYLQHAEASSTDRLAWRLSSFAAQLALTALLASHGVEPSDIVGQGTGEIAAAVASGALQLDTALRLVAASEQPETATFLQSVQPYVPQRRLFSATAGALRMEDLGAAHWQRVLQGASVATVLPAPVTLESVLAHEGELTAVIEIGLQPALCDVLRGQLQARNATPLVICALQGAGNARHALLRSLARIHEWGVDIRQRRQAGARSRVLSLPLHPWQPDRFWLHSSSPSGVTLERDAGTILGGSVCNARSAGVRVWQNTLQLARHTSLADHQVADRVLLPAAAQLTMMIQALVIEGANPCELRVGRFHKALVLEAAPRTVQTILSYREGRPAAVSIAAPANQDDADLYSQAEVATPSAAPASRDLDALRARCTQRVSAESLYESLAAAGLNYGPSFRRVRELHVGAGMGLATLEAVNDAAFVQDAIDLRLLDAALHALLPVGRTLPQRQAMQGAVPVGFERVSWFAPLRGSAYAYVTASEGEGGKFQASVQLLDAQGAVLGSIEHLSFSAAGQRTALQRVEANLPAHRFRSLYCYEPVWRPQAANHGNQLALRCAIFMDERGVGAALAQQVHAAGGRCLLVHRGERFERTAGGMRMRPAHAADHRAVFEAISTEFGARPDAVLDLWSLELGDAAAVELRVSSALEQIKAATNAVFLAPPLLMFVTSGVHGVAGESATRPEGALLAGLLRVLPFENPTLAARCVDVAPGTVEQMAQELWSELLIRDAELDVARARGQRHVRRIVPAHLARPQASLPIAATGSYLVTGATGGVGRGLVEWLVQQGARHIIMLGRRPRSSAITALQERLAVQGAQVQYLSADLAEPEELRAALAGSVDLSRIRGVVHAAGVLADSPLLSMTHENLLAALRPKVHGLLNLMQHLDPTRLDWLVLFSSAAAMLGSPGQANYCAANAFLDAYAHAARARGVQVVSAGWGPWAEAGMAAERQAAIDNIAAGLNFIAPDEGCAAFGALLTHSSAHLGVFPFDLTDLIQHYPEGPGFSAFEALFEPDAVVLRAAGRSNAVAQRPELEAQYVAPQSDIERIIAGMWQRALGVDRIGIDDSFFELGGDSVFGNQVVVQINRHFNVSIAPERAFERYTVAGLAALVEQQLLEEIAGLSEEAVAEQLAQAVPGGGDEAVA